MNAPAVPIRHDPGSTPVSITDETRFPAPYVPNTHGDAYSPDTHNAGYVSGQRPATRSLDAIITDIRDVHDHAVHTIAIGRAEADEKIRALEVTCASLADELAAERRRANLAEAAGLKAINAVAAGILREEALETRIVALGQRAERVRGAYEAELDARYQKFRTVCGQRDALAADNERLRAELAAAQSRRGRLFGRRDGGAPIGGRL